MSSWERERNDHQIALQLQEQLKHEVRKLVNFGADRPLSIVDESWELVDPIPDIRQLFLQFNDAYFNGLLAGVEVKWSSRMTLCAGVCSYEGQGGLCSIRLSQPLLKLRPRKDLVETLLHEMIHAVLFVTHNNKDHDAHGPEFHRHMHRINNKTGTKISVYHSFHDEVNEYRQHWWKCDGRCRSRKPFYGIVRRSMNRAPSRHDTWWQEHQATCGGTFIKIKEPDDYSKKTKRKREETTTSQQQQSDENRDATKRLPLFHGTGKRLGDNTNTGLSSWLSRGAPKVPSDPKLLDIKSNKGTDSGASSSTVTNRGGNAIVKPVAGWSSHVTEQTASTSNPNTSRVNDHRGGHGSNDAAKVSPGTKGDAMRFPGRGDTLGFGYVTNTSSGSTDRQNDTHNDKCPSVTHDIDFTVIPLKIAEVAPRMRDVTTKVVKPEVIDLSLENDDDDEYRANISTMDASSKVPCPSCSLVVAREMINRHLDECLAI